MPLRCTWSHGPATDGCVHTWGHGLIALAVGRGFAALFIGRGHAWHHPCQGAQEALGRLDAEALAEHMHDDRGIVDLARSEERRERVEQLHRLLPTERLVPRLRRTRLDLEVELTRDVVGAEGPVDGRTLIVDDASRLLA